MTLTQYLLLLPGPVFGQETVNEVVRTSELTELSENVINKVEARIELPFVPMMQSNLCFIQNAEVLPEFRTSFQDMHLLDVFYACSLDLDSSSISLDLLPFPTNSDLFWKLSEYGKQLRILHSLNFKLPYIIFPFVSIPPYVKEANMGIKYPFLKQDNELEAGNIWVNAQNYFSDVPKPVWDLKIHQRHPAQEALKILQDTSLTRNKVLGYQKLLYALEQSLSIVKTIKGLDPGKPLL